MPLYGRSRNPYSQLGSSAADIVNTFINKKGIAQGGYLDASKKMADIDATRMGTDKIMQELSRDDRANSMTAADYNAMQGGDFGTRMEGATRMGATPGGIDDIMGMLGGASMQDTVTGNVPLDMRPTAQNYLGQEGQENDVQGMYRAVLAAQENARNKPGDAPVDMNDPATMLGMIDKHKAAAFAEYMMNNEGATTGAGLTSANRKATQMSDAEIMKLLYPYGFSSEEERSGAQQTLKQFKQQMGYTGSSQGSGSAQYNYVPGKGLIPAQ